MKLLERAVEKSGYIGGIKCANAAAPDGRAKRA
jgi:hypothetical protein